MDDSWFAFARLFFRKPHAVANLTSYSFPGIGNVFQTVRLAHGRTAVDNAAAAGLDLGAQPVDGLTLEAQRLTELARACEAYRRGDSGTAINKHSLITPNGFH